MGRLSTKLICASFQIAGLAGHPSGNIVEGDEGNTVQGETKKSIGSISRSATEDIGLRNFNELPSE
jgi:hypothetical protein